MTNQPPEALINNQKLDATTDLDNFRLTLLQNYLNGSLILGTIVFFVNLFITVQSRNLISSLITIGLFLILFLITFVKQLSARLRSMLLCLVYFGAGLFSILLSGLNANGFLYFFIAVFLLGVLLRGFWWIAGLILSGLIIITIGVLIQFEVIGQGIFILQRNSFLNWIATLTILLFLIFVFISPMNHYLNTLARRFSSIEKNETAVRQDNISLSERVESLTLEIDRRRSRMIAARQIARDISNETSIAKLMNDVVELIKNQFNFYHAGLFLNDENNEYAVLKAATGAVGQNLLNNGHKLRINEEGIVGYVIARGESRIAFDVGDDAVHFKNPALPDTRSEMAVPIKIGVRAFGALDVQSEMQNAFTDEDTEILQTIADQLATVIDKTRQIEKLTAAISEIEDVYAIYTQTFWQKHLRGSKKNLSYQFTDNKLSPKISIDESEREVLQTSRKMKQIGKKGSKSSSLAIPIKLRGQVLGVVNIRYDGQFIPKELEELVETASDRLAVTLENARLLEEIQERAERENIVGSIATKVRSSANIDSILQTTVSELGRTLGVNEVRIQLKTPDVETQDSF